MKIMCVQDPKPRRTYFTPPVLLPPALPRAKSLSHFPLFVTPWTAARQAPLSTG